MQQNIIHSSDLKYARKKTQPTTQQKPDSSPGIHQE